MQNLFLAHSSKDKEFARNLYDDLLKLGFRVWFDEVEMEPGDSLIQKIGSAIRSSMNLAVLLSKDSVSSKWVEKEVSVAMTGQLAGSNINVIPIRLDDATLPPFLSDISYVDFRKSEKMKLEFARLVKSLLSSSIQQGTLLRLVSSNATVTATDQHHKKFDPSYVLFSSDESDPKSNRTYWLTSNDTEATISLKLPRSYPIRLLRILNTQNQQHKDRATHFISISFATGEEPSSTIWRGAVPAYDTWLNLWLDSMSANLVKVKIEKWAGLGGGLNCIEVYSEE